MVQTELLNGPGLPQLSISVAPKSGCHAVREWLWELGAGKRYSGRGIFEDFGHQELCRSVLSPKNPGELRIAIHRGGVSRMRAIYDHRVIRCNEWVECTIEEFAWNLADACVESAQIHHHARPQWHWLGGDPRRFDIVLPFAQLHRLSETASRHLGQDVPPLLHTHKTAEPTLVSDEARKLFECWTGYDTAIGWDGKFEWFNKDTGSNRSLP